MSGLSWFRMYGEFISDPVVQSLAFEDQRHFVGLLCLKCQGLLDRDFPTPSLRADIIRKAIGLDGKAWDEMRSRLTAVRLIDDDLQPINWDKRQFLSDSSTERVRTFRERSRNVSVTPSETEADTDTETEKRGEEAPPAKRARPATHLPADFELTDERRGVATTEGLDAARTFAKFRNFWQSASGQRARKRNWDAAWRYWCQNDRGGGKPSTVGKFVPPPDDPETAHA
jgi:hypothetical protein